MTQTATRITNERRFRKYGLSCPICEGHSGKKPGRGERCAGYASEDGEYVFCTREEYAGSLTPKENTTPRAFCHKMYGRCNCGTQHNPERETSSRKGKPEEESARIVATYSYHDERGNLLYQAVRYEPKRFMQRRPHNGGWVWDMNGVTRVLYHLPDLLKAAPGEPVYIVEGEKDVDRLRHAGLLATCNVGGAGKWEESYSEVLRNRHVIILPDNDVAGRSHAHTVYTSLMGKAASVKTITLPGLPEKGDVSDWLAAGGTVERLAALVKETPENAGPKEVTLDEAVAAGDIQAIRLHTPAIIDMDEVQFAHLKMNIKQRFGPQFPMKEFSDLLRAERLKCERERNRNVTILSAQEIAAKKFVKRVPVVDLILHIGLNVLMGKAKIGKSWLDLALGIAVALGTPALGRLATDKGDVLCLALEDNEERLNERLNALTEPGGKIPANFEIAMKWPRLDKGGIEALRDWCEQHPQRKLIIIDPWTLLKPSVRLAMGETSYDADYRALEMLKALADDYAVSVLIQIHKTKKKAEDYFDDGNASSGLSACADYTLNLTRGRGEADATLEGDGRTASEVSLALSFNSGWWNVLGTIEEYALSKASKEIIDILKQSDKPMTPQEITKMIDGDIAPGTIRKRLLDMKNRGEIKDTGKGYTVNLNSGINNNFVGANSGNGGNVSNGGNGGNGGNADSQQGGSSESVTSSVTPRYPNEDSEVTPLQHPVERAEEDSVTNVTPVTTIGNGHTPRGIYDAQLATLEQKLQAQFEKTGIPFIWKAINGQPRGWEQQNGTHTPTEWVERLRVCLYSRNPSLASNAREVLESRVNA